MKNEIELKEQISYITEEVKACLRESQKEIKQAIKDDDIQKQILERRSVLEYSTVLCIIKNSKDKKRREYEKNWGEKKNGINL